MLINSHDAQCMISYICFSIVTSERSGSNPSSRLWFSFTSQFLYLYKYLIFSSDESGIEIFQDPFCHCIIPNLIEDADFIEHLQDEVMDLTYVEKNNDLYKFHQVNRDVIMFNQIKCIKELVVFYKEHIDYLISPI